MNLPIQFCPAKHEYHQIIINYDLNVHGQEQLDLMRFQRFLFDKTRRNLRGGGPIPRSESVRDACCINVGHELLRIFRGVQ